MKHSTAIVAASLAAIALLAAPQPAQARSGKVDGHYYKWIFEGKKFIVCTNVGKKRGQIVSQYLEWAYSAMASQFDALNRGKFLKKWEINFDKWGQATGSKTRDGSSVFKFNAGGKKAWGFKNPATGWLSITLMPEKKGLFFHERATNRKKMIVHYAADENEEYLIRAAYEPVRVAFGAKKTGRAFFSAFFGVLLIDESSKRLPLFKTLDTAVHEACHYMFEYASFTKPVWFNEGYCYFLQVTPEGKLTAGQPRFSMLRGIRKAREAGKLVPISTLVGITNKQFRADPKRESLLYDESWALFSYLNSPASGMQRKFLSFYNRMRNGEDANKAFRQTFNVSDLQRRVLAWCDTQYNQMLKNHVEYLDMNKDGTPDRYDFYRDGYLQEHRIDKNFNGKVDTWMVMYPNGKRKLQAWDKDHNGKPDFWNTWDNRGSLTAVIMDKNKDGKPDVWQIYKNKVWKEERHDRNGDGKIDAIYYLNARKQVTKKQLDNNYDGYWD